MKTGWAVYSLSCFFFFFLRWFFLKLVRPQLSMKHHCHPWDLHDEQVDYRTRNMIDTSKKKDILASLDFENCWDKATAETFCFRSFLV